MNPGLKQRLIGAIVLIALAVIFLPMLLPGNGRSTMPLFGSNIPKAPGTKFEPIEIPLQVPPPAPPAEVSVIDQPQPGDVASKEKLQQPAPAEPVPATSSSTSSAPAPTPPAQAQQPVQSQAASVQQSPAQKQSVPAQPVASTPAPSRTPGEAWDVQLGSFSSSVNALALQDKLRKAGFRAYVEKVKGNQGISYRVRVGPESSHDRADSLREQVQGKMKLKGIVVPHKS